MKVCHLSHIYPRKKDDIIVPFLSLMIRSIADAGIDTEIVVPRESGLPSHEIADGIRIFRFRAPMRLLSYKGDLHERVFGGVVDKVFFAFFLFSFFAASVIIAKKTKPDVIHAHWWVPSGVIACCTSIVTGMPYVITSHGTDVFILRRFKFLRPLAKIVIGRSAKTIVLSTALKDLLVEELGIEDSKIVVIPEPLEVGLFLGSEIKRKCEGHILSVARLVERKGLDYLLRACGNLKSSGMKFKLTIIGWGPEEERLKSLIGELGLGHNVEMIRSLPHSKMGAYFSKADVFVLPTVTDWKGETEGLGVVILEAMCSKRPVVATRTGGITDVIRHNETGLLVGERDSVGLAKAMGKIFSDKNLRERLARKGYEEAVMKFSPERISHEIISVYRSVLAGRR